jgi:sugar/nucleoside kinase (ribokinase family)
MTLSEITYVTLGGLRQDYCITHDGQVYLGVIGGNAIYSAVGAKLWSESVGLVSRVGSDFPAEWLDELLRAGFNIDGITQLSEPINTCTFYAYLSPEVRIDTNPASHFLRINHPLPKALIDYRSSTEGQDNRDEFTPLAIRPNDLPIHLNTALGAHLAPAEYLTHTTIPFQLRELGVPIVTLDPSERYMNPSFKEELPIVISGLDAFLPSESEARAFFRSPEMDLFQMAKVFSEWGCRWVVIKRGARGQFLWDNDAKQGWQIPAYPARVKDVTGAGDAFCGGFLVGLEETKDAIEATLRGNISASLTIEGSEALFALEALPGLKEERLNTLRPYVKRV